VGVKLIDDQGEIGIIAPKKAPRHSRTQTPQSKKALNQIRVRNPVEGDHPFRSQADQ
jgi:hypothetical protein